MSEQETHWLSYRDVTAFRRKSFELMSPTPAGMHTIKPGIIWDSHGNKNNYIEWHVGSREDVTINLLTYTDAPIMPNGHNQIIDAAFKFITFELLDQ
jgi:hypothetical protein